MFRELALRISQKVLIGITQFYGYALPICWCLQRLPSKNLVNQKSKHLKNIYIHVLSKKKKIIFYNHKKYGSMMAAVRTT